jgi:hypothetical protein
VAKEEQGRARVGEVESEERGVGVRRRRKGGVPGRAGWALADGRGKASVGRTAEWGREGPGVGGGDKKLEWAQVVGTKRYIKDDVCWSS